LALRRRDAEATLRGNLIEGTSVVACIGVVGLVVLLVVPGTAALAWLSGRRSAVRFRLVEVIALVLALSVLVSSLAGIVLAETGAFNFSLLAGIVAIFTGVLLVLRPGRIGLDQPRGWPVAVAFLGALVAVCAFLYLRPHEYVFGGWDPSVYVNTGASIERTGGIVYHDEAFATLPPATQKAFSHRRQGIDQRFPGLLVADPETGLITPQFHHLYPTWLAAFRAGGSDRAMLYVNPLFGVLSVLVLFVLCRRFLPSGAAYAATILLALNLAQVWQVRFPTSEVLAQLCILTMLYLLLLYFETGSIAAAVLAALALDMAFQARFDSVLLVPVLAVVLYVRNLRAWQRRDWILVVGGAVALAHVVLHSIFISYLYRPGLTLLTRHPTFVVAAAAVILVVAVVFLAAFRRWPEELASFFTGPAVRGVVIALIIVAAFFAYYVRPALRGGGPDAENFVAIGWLLTPAGLVLALAGACLLVARSKTSGELALLVVGLAFLALYTKWALIDDFYMWRARRFVPIVIPMLCAFAAYGLAVIAAPLKRWGPIACGAVALVLVAVPLAKNRVIATTRDYAGALYMVDEGASKLDPDAVYICNHYWLAMPLAMLHGFETYAVSDPSAAKCGIALAFADNTIRQGRKVCLVDQERPHVFPGLVCERLTSCDFWSQRLERTKGRLPRAAEPVHLEAAVYRLVPIADAPDDTADVNLTWEFEPDWFDAGRGFMRRHMKSIKIVETPDGERHDPTPETPPSEIKREYACLTARRSAMWIPYDPSRGYVAEARVSSAGIEHGVEVVVAGRTLATIEPRDGFHTVTVEIPPGIETGAPRRALVEFLSLAPPHYAGPMGVYIDRLRLRSAE
jgi:hypothetical protein